VLERRGAARGSGAPTWLGVQGHDSHWQWSTSLVLEARVATRRRSKEDRPHRRLDASSMTQHRRWVWCLLAYTGELVTDECGLDSLCSPSHQEAAALERTHT
jgi:hypothetical protein